MEAVPDNRYYAMRAQQELDLAALANDPIVKTLHLNMAAEYATLRERAELETLDARSGTSARNIGPSAELRRLDCVC